MPASYDNHRAQTARPSCWPGACRRTTRRRPSEILSWADLHGVDSHGMSMIPGYDGLRRSGRAKMDARPEDRAGDPGLRAGRWRRRARSRAGAFRHVGGDRQGEAVGHGDRRGHAIRPISAPPATTR